MRRLSLLLPAVLVLFGLLSISAGAGEISPELADQLEGKAAGEKISVWIKLPDFEGGQAFKAALRAEHRTRSGRYQAALGKLKSEHSARQQALLGQLRSLEARGEAANVRSRWIANMVEAEVSAARVQALANRPDVEMIYAVPTLELIDPIKVSPTLSQSAAGVTDNLKLIRADDAWAAGYTGQGRLICSFDTGIDGDHPALLPAWKGNDGDSAAAWFDPLDGASFPHVFPISGGGHGTHVMGIMVGHDDATGDTTGVALDAQWISAAVIDLGGAPILDAFEWAANPDGDPNSLGDVPDVINHSWGIKDAGCANIFYSMIDNLEALGIVNIFAAGNEGAQLGTIRNPANRALDSTDCFAVGSVSYTTNPPLVSDGSSRGPSDCNGAIKPNVMAPGVSVYSTFPNDTYTFLGGTSMAAPHVSGLVALMRQKNPDASPEEIKAAILTTAPDFGYALPDNEYGWGIIDCMAALNELSSPPSNPSIRVYAFDHVLVNPGDVFTGEVILLNRGAVAATSVTGSVITADPALSFPDGFVNFGTVPALDTARSTDFLEVGVDDTVTTGRILSADLQINGSGFSTTLKLFVKVGETPDRTIFTHDANRIEFTITNYGTFGLGDGTFFPAGGRGFRFDGATQSELWEAAVMVSSVTGNVSDGARNAAGEPDGDFAVAPGGELAVSEPGTSAAEQTVSRFTDERSENPIGIELEQHTYAFTDTVYDDFVIMRYIITNRNNFGLNSVRFSMYCDWDVVTFSSNAGGWNGADSITWTAYHQSSSYFNYRGVTVLEGPVAGSHTGDATQITYFPDGFRESEKYQTMTSGFFTAETFKTSYKDLMQVTTVGPLSILAGQSDTVTFAVVAGDTEADMIDAAYRAKEAYRLNIGDCCRGIRGNVNLDLQESINVSDALYLVDYLFRAGPLPPCDEEADVNASSDIFPNVADLTYLVDFIFRAGAAPGPCP